MALARGTRPRARGRPLRGRDTKRSSTLGVGARSRRPTRRRRRAAASKQPFTTTGPSATPARSSIANAVSISSLTGVSSGSVTSITWQRAGSREQLDDVGGLLADRPDAHRVEQPAGRQEERDRVAGRGRVDDDQVGGARLVERLHLAEHEDVLHARAPRSRRRRARPTPTSRFEMPLHPVGLEVVDERGVGREEPGPDPGCELGLVVAERGRAEHRGQPRFALDLDDQHAQPGARRGDRERGRHRRLPDAALARDDDDAGGGAELRDLHPRMLREPRCRSSAARRIRAVARRWRSSLLGLAFGAAAAARPRRATTPATAERHRRRAGRTGCSTRRTPRSIATSCDDAEARRLDAARRSSSTRSGAVDADVDALVDAVRERDGPGRRVGRSVGRRRARRERVARAAARRSSRSRPARGIGPVVPGAASTTPATRRAPRSAASARRASSERPQRRQRRRGRRPPAVGRRRRATRRRRRDPADARRVHRRRSTADRARVAGERRRRSTPPTSIGEGSDRRRQPNQEVRFHKLDLGQQLAHTLSTPSVAYFLFVAGLRADRVRVLHRGRRHRRASSARSRVIGACFGFSHLPVQWWAIGLLLLGLFGLAIDVQAGGLGAWTFIGGASLVAGSIWLYGGSSRLDPAWWVLALVCGGTVLFMLSGMTAMIRSRFSTPTIGREELIGEMGAAEVDVDPDGVVRIRDALWRARTNRATPITAGRRGPRRRGRGPRARGRTARGRRAATTATAPAAARVSRHRIHHASLTRPFVRLRGLALRSAASRPGRGGGDMVALGLIHETWHLNAACRGPESALFFPPSLAGATRRARAARSAGQGDLRAVRRATRLPRLRAARARAARHLGRSHRGRTSPSPPRRLTGTPRCSRDLVRPDSDAASGP